MSSLGEPVWTEGHFRRIAAQDDLGIEALGASLLRELVPGIVETSISAGYYAFYPFLLDEFAQRRPDELRRSEFQKFYRRFEAAFAVASSCHRHRGNLRGINGTNAALGAVESTGSGMIDIAALAAPGGYMQTGLGGYGLFYRPALEDIGATRLGSGNTVVDRVTDLGRAAAEGFRATIEGTDYWRSFVSADVVPLEVLQELGEAVCPCGVPGRPDQDPILDIFFRAAADTERWQILRTYRVQSLGLLLEFHSLRTEYVSGIGEWRRALISGQIGGSNWDTAFSQHRDAWRAYQYRETLVASLTTLFTDLLYAFDELMVGTPGEATDLLLSKIDWSALPSEPWQPFGELAEAFQIERDDPVRLIEMAEAAMGSAGPVSADRSITQAIGLIAALANEPSGTDDFATILQRGEETRLSVSYMSRWLQARSGLSAIEVIGELVRLLFHRHLRVATAKLSIADHRDPFCLAEVDDGRYRVIRSDDPFWTGARFATLNHLLWTLGALDSPDGDGRPTDLGRSLLAGVIDSG